MIYQDLPSAVWHISRCFITCLFCFFFSPFFSSRHPHAFSFSLSLVVGHFPIECLEDHEVTQLLRCFSSDYPQTRNICLDGAMAHHLQQCYYHLRLFKNWLISGQDDLECLYGTARLTLCPLLIWQGQFYCLLYGMLSALRNNSKLRYSFRQLPF